MAEDPVEKDPMASKSPSPAEMPGGQQVSIVNENIDVSPNGQTRSGSSVPPLMQDDRTLRTWAAQVLRYVVTLPSGVVRHIEQIALGESDGTPKVVNYGKDSSGNQDAIRTNASQQVQLEVVDPSIIETTLQGMDGASNADTLRTDDARIIRSRGFEPYTHVTPQTIAATAETIYTVPISTVAVVELELVNNSSSNRTVTAYIVENGGSAGDSNVVLFEVTVNRRTVGIRIGPYTMEAGATVQALCSSADAITGHVYVKEYGTGDAVAY